LSVRWDIKSSTEINEVYKKGISSGYQPYRGEENVFRYDILYLEVLYWIIYGSNFTIWLAIPLQIIPMLLMLGHFLIQPIIIIIFYPDLAEFTLTQYLMESVL